MNPGIFLIQENEELVEMNEQAYESEKLLQTWLAKYPSLLVGNQIDAKVPRRWLLIEQECGVPSEEGGGGRWAIDHLFLDQDAIPTIVEVKRSTDTRIRREVVGQMLDYAANAVVYWPISHMRERFAASCRSTGVDPDEKLSAFLGEEGDPEEFWQKANRNLQDRNLRLLFVADIIPSELQRIVEFLNEQMDRTEVLAVEIKQFVGAGKRGLVPRLIGLTAEAQEKKVIGPRAERQWDEQAVLQALEEKKGPGEANVARKLLQWAKENVSFVTWGKGANDGSFTPTLSYVANARLVPFRLYTYGNIEILFNRLQEHAPFVKDEKRLEMLHRLNQIPGVSLPEDGIHRRPSIPTAALIDPASLKQFLQVMEWVIQEVKSALTARKTNQPEVAN
ncbi:MAG TPA: hypothetical protein VGN86_00510 [Pyrinomonadaceae bacterium]|jgi:hypothetical protein|nr:hypothetical protein [Pyrinomonadaceae bacterium]